MPSGSGAAPVASVISVMTENSLQEALQAILRPNQYGYLFAK
jgi:hypothetical protein